MNKDLTVGDPQRVLWKFCLPLFGSIIFQQLYNIADSFVAGKFIGETALAAVGNSYEITLIFIAFAFGCNIGCSVIVSQMFGAKRYCDLKTSVYTSYIAGGALCLLLMALGILLCSYLLSLINTPNDILADSKLYLDIYILGFPFVLFYNVSTGIFSALGDSKTPFIFLAASSTANIAVDILFVAAFGMGISGVAWATFICQGVSCVLAVVFVLKRLRGIKTDGRAKVFSRKLFVRISAIAVPSILQQSFISVGNIIIQGIINGFGSGVIAGYSASIKLSNLAITSLSTIGNGISTYAAQNIGAGKHRRINDGFKVALKMVLIICIPFTVLYFAFGKYLLYIFLDSPTVDALNTGVTLLKIIAPFYFIVALKLVADGILRGVGRMKQFVTTTFSDLILRVALAFVFSSFLGPTGIWLAWPVGWFFGALLSLIFYYSFKRSKTD